MNNIENDMLYAVEQNYSKLPMSAIFGILKNDRRRWILEVLKKDGKLSIRSLSEKIARIEAGVEEPNSGVRKSVYVSLLQTHIPKMESLKILNYDREKDSIERLPSAQNFDIYIETVNKGDIPWNQFYLGISTLAIFGSIIIYLGLMNWITSPQWMLFISVVFFASSMVHFHLVRRHNE
jgi:hypothetical protein